MAQTVPHWGEWLIQRSRVVGFRRHMDLAQAVGCTPERITQWGSSSKPPDQMRKGFDAKLAYALQTTRKMLFEDWQTTPPDQARRVMLHADQLALEEEFSWDPDLQELLRKILPYLAPTEMEWLVLQVALKVLEKKDNRGPLFRQIIERYKLFEHYERTGERLPTAASIPEKPIEGFPVIHAPAIPPLGAFVIRGDEGSGQKRVAEEFTDTLAKFEQENARRQAEHQALQGYAAPPSSKPPANYAFPNSSGAHQPGLPPRYSVDGLQPASKPLPSSPNVLSSPPIFPDSVAPPPPPVESIRNRRMKPQNPTEPTPRTPLDRPKSSRPSTA